MATLEMKPSGRSRGAPGEGGGGPADRRVWMGLALALLAIVTYAIFAHGAIQAPAEPRLQVALAVVAALAAAAHHWGNRSRRPIPPGAWVALLLLGGFALWSGISLIWSVAPDLTWIEFNRDFTYALVFGLALVLGASLPRALPTVAHGFIALITLVTLYALGQKLVPGINVGGVIDFNQTARIARLQEPLGYWNGLALLLAMAAPVALYLGAGFETPPRVRLAALISLELMFVAVAFTYSRGGVIALVAGLAAFLALSRSALRLLMWLALAAVASVPAIVLALTSHALTANGVSLSQRESAGWLLLVVVLTSSVLLWLGGERLQRAERTVTLTPSGRRNVVRGLYGGLGTGVVIGLIALAVSSRGLPGTFSHLWTSFTSTGGVSVSDPARLISADSANRWVWWKEAASAFSHRPAAGWGAGSFPVVHLLFRRDTLTVQHPHSMPLQWLAETGVIGFLLIAGAWAMLLRSGLTSTRRQLTPVARMMAAAVCGALVAYTVHALYDWDWDIPGLTLPLLVLGGVLAAAVPRDPAASPSPAGRLMSVPTRAGRLYAPARLAALALAIIGLASFAASAVLPGVASSDASSALVAASGSTLPQVQQAQRQARAASSLDPISDTGPRAAAVAAEHRGDLRLARAYLIQALRRQPSDASAWASLAFIDLRIHRPAQALTAAQSIIRLDPMNTGLRGFAYAVAAEARRETGRP